jgi:4-hydroxybenzoate polyprenyltransferase
VGGAFGLGWPYYLGLAIAAGIAVYHQWLIRKRDRDACFKAFQHNNYLGMVVFAGILLERALAG